MEITIKWIINGSAKSIFISLSDLNVFYMWTWVEQKPLKLLIKNPRQQKYNSVWTTSRSSSKFGGWTL